MVCMAAQPILSFLIAMPSPAYDWSTLAFCPPIEIGDQG